MKRHFTSITVQLGTEMTDFLFFTPVEVHEFSMFTVKGERGVRERPKKLKHYFQNKNLSLEFSMSVNRPA